MCFSYHGGNSNNSLQCGAVYRNLNNTASNANWNIGASHSYLKSIMVINVPSLPYLLVKINSEKASFSSQSKEDERIRRLYEVI